MEFLISNSSEKDKRDWISRLMNDMQSSDVEKEIKEELIVVAASYALTIKKPESSPYVRYLPDHRSGYRDPPIDPQVYYEQGISMLIRASILLQDKDFFATAVSIDPGSISQSTIWEILEALSTTRFGLYREG